METPESSQPTNALMALSDRSNDRLSRLLKTYVMTTSAISVLSRWYQRAKAQMTYTVAVPGNDDLFHDVHQWLIKQIPPGRRRAVLARFQRSGSYESAFSLPTSGHRELPSVQLLYDGNSVQTVQLDGYRVQVHLERPETRMGDSDGPIPSWMADLYRLVFTCSSPEGRDAVERLLRDLALSHADDPRRVFVATSWDWRRQPKVLSRPLDSVILRQGQLERITEDLDDFLKSEDRYAKWGLPYHRGYLFEGPPGCGKTSTAKVIADHFGLDVYYLPIPVVENDSRLVQMLNEVQPRSMLLLEDVDVVHAARVRNDEQKGVTMSGLLNALDGFVTPHGLVTVMTTNHAEVLDEALVRPGRVDVSEHIGLADAEQLQRLIGMLFPDREVTQPMCDLMAPALVMEAAKRHVMNLDDAFDAVMKAIVG